MAGLGIAITWFGYAVMYYGITQIKGGNWGFLDLILPNRWASAAATAPDGGGTPAGVDPAAWQAFLNHPSTLGGNTVVAPNAGAASLAAQARAQGQTVIGFTPSGAVITKGP